MSLKPKQRLAAGLWALGVSNSDIARRLSISVADLSSWLEQKNFQDLADKYIAESCRSSFDDIFKGAVGDAISVITEVMLDPEERASSRLKAAEQVLDRALGKPEQKTTVETNLLAEFVSKVESLRNSHIPELPARDLSEEDRDLEQFIEDIIPEPSGGVVGLRSETEDCEDILS